MGQKVIGFVMHPTYSSVIEFTRLFHTASGSSWTDDLINHLMSFPSCLNWMLRYPISRRWPSSLLFLTAVVVEIYTWVTFAISFQTKWISLKSFDQYRGAKRNGLSEQHNGEGRGHEIGYFIFKGGVTHNKRCLSYFKLFSAGVFCIRIVGVSQGIARI